MKKYSILYVDDEEINLRTFRTAFRREFNIYLAESASIGLEILASEPIDVVITDQRMPNMTGVEFLEQVNKRFPTIPPKRLILSGYSPDKDIQKAFDEYQLFQFISKPWEYDFLREIIFKSLKS